MSLEILFCESCKKFTLKGTCDCGNKSNQPIPAKFSIDDNYAKYRREAKKEEWKSKNLI